MKKKMIYLVDSSIQYENNKDTVRTHKILKSLVKAGKNVTCITKYGFPYDRDHNISNKKVSDRLEGVTYIKLGKKNDNYNNNCIIKYLEKYIKALIDLCLAQNITVIHSSTSYLNGIAGLYTAKYLNIQHVYEIRGFTEDYLIDARPELFGSDLLNMRNKLEDIIFNESDHLYASSYDIIDELVEKGINKENIELLPDAINMPIKYNKKPNNIKQDKTNKKSIEAELAENIVVNESIKTDKNLVAPNDNNKIELLKKYKLYDIDLIIGFAGDIYDINGWKKLLSTVNEICKNNKMSFKFVYIGGKAFWHILTTTNIEINKSMLYVNTTYMDPEDVYKYYNLLDIFICPENLINMSEEILYKAMIMENLLIIKNTENVDKIITNGSNGLIYSNDEELENYLLLNLEDKIKISSNGRRYVINNRLWDVVVSQIN